jgi:lichenysin synthetase B
VLRLDPPLTRDLVATAERYGTQPGTLLLGAFGVLLYKYSGQEHLLVGVRLSGRGAGQVSITVDPAASFASHLRRLEGAAGDATPLDAPPQAGFADHPVPPGAAPGTDLALSTAAAGDAYLDLSIDFEEALFDRPTIERLSGHLRQVLRWVLARPEGPVRDVDLLTDAERAQILGPFNDTTRPYPSDVSVHRLFEEQAELAPERLAVVHGDRRLTYGELNRRANGLARRLRAAGVEVGQPVGLLMPRTPEMVLATLAILKAGGAYVPVDPDYPPERAAYILRDSDAGVLVTTPGLAGSVPFEGRTMTADAHNDGDAGMAGEDGASGAGAGPDDLAYVIYTSGTTGKPKGVEVCHRSVVRLVRGAGYVPLSGDTRILATCSIVFDVATFELWGALLNGGRLHLAGNDVILDAASLGRALVAHAITTMWLTAPLFNQLVEQDASIFRPLSHLLVGGDVLSPRHVGKVMEACPDVAVINGYGPTENTTFSTAHLVVPADLNRIPIGRPIANSTAYVVNRDGQLCPIGVRGELCMGGDGVARGYRNRSELNERAFVDNPFVPGHRMYRSGDVASWRPDGVIDFFGRSDQQVKVRGFRIELGEIEGTLLDHPGVREAVVLARPRPNGADKYLCAYYVAGREVSPGDLRAHLGRRLPGHMVPPFLVALDRMPLNASGKIDKARLPEPGAGTTGAAYVAPRSDAEQTLVHLLEEVLGVDGVGIGHDLRDLGVDSLTATLLATRIEQVFGRRVPPGRILGDATVEQIVHWLEHEPAQPARHIQPAPPRPAYPASPQQRQVYFEQLKDESATHYNVPVRVDLPPECDVTRLGDALALLTRRHDALRTQLAFDAGQVRQQVLPSVGLPLETHDGPPPAARDFVRPFDLAQAPLWRAGIYRARDRVHLLVDLHHAVTDGLSIGLLFAELFALYRDPSGASLPGVALQYPDYAEWVAGEAASAARAEDRRYWRTVFARPQPPTDLPVDFPRPAIRLLDGGVVEFGLEPERCEALRRLARQHGVTLFAVLAGAHSALLAHLTGEPDVTIGMPVAGRSVQGLDRTLGMFVNTVCLRTEARMDQPFGAYLQLVARQAAEASAHQDHPFEELVADVAPQRDYRRTPLFDALLAFHSSRYLHADFCGEQVPLRLEWNGRSVFDLNMQVYESAGTLRVSWQYGSRLFRRSTVEGLRDTFLEVLDCIVVNPGIPLGDLPVRGGVVRAPVPEITFDL